MQSYWPKALTGQVPLFRMRSDSFWARFNAESIGFVRKLPEIAERAWRPKGRGG